MLLRITLLLACNLLYGAALHASDLDVKVNKVYEDKNQIVVDTKNGLYKIPSDKDLNQGDGYEIKLNRRALQDGNKKILRRKLSLDDETELKRLQFEAQSLYEKKDYAAAWAKVNEAQEIDPWSIQLINMKGTLLYLTGSPELALAYWRESLKIDDNQPFLKATISKVESVVKEKKP